MLRNRGESTFKEGRGLAKQVQKEEWKEDSTFGGFIFLKPRWFIKGLHLVKNLESGCRPMGVEERGDF